MLIERIDIESFGKLKGVHLMLNNRINVFYGVNESGKSTIAAFIKYVFYGFTGTKKQSADENEKKLYMPWRTNRASGSMIIHFRDRKYRIERENSERDRVRIFDLTTNLQVFEGMEPGEVFFKMNEETFSKSAFIRQLETPETGGKVLADMIQNIVFTADEDVNTQRALKDLNDAKKLLYKNNKSDGILARLIKSRDSIKSDFENSQAGQRELLQMESQMKENEERIHVNNAKNNELQDELDNYKAYNAMQELQKIESARKQVNNLKESYERTVERCKFVEFIPDYEYYKDLVVMASDVKAANEKLQGVHESRKSSQVRYNECVNQNITFKRIEEGGGVAEVGRKYTTLKKREKFYSTLIILFLILGIIFSAVSAAVYFLKLTEFPLPVYFLPLLFFIAMFFIISVKKKIESNTRDFYTSFDFSSEVEFTSVLDDYPDTETTLETLKADLDVYNSLFADEEKKFNVLYRKAKELLMKWNRTPESETRDGEDIMKIAEQVKEAADELGKVKQLYEKYEAVLATKLEGVDERELYTLANMARTPKLDENQINYQLNFVTQQQKSLTEKVHNIEKSIAVLSAKLPDPVVLSSQINYFEEQIQNLTSKHDAMELAIKVLEESCDELKNNISPKLTASSGRLFKAATNGTYIDLLVDTNLTLDVTDGDQTVDIELLSAGTRDLAYICLRVAILELLYDSDMPPVICDDSFTRLDNDRYENVLKVLSYISQKTQVFIFTCHDREIKYLQNYNCNFINM